MRLLYRRRKICLAQDWLFPRMAELVTSGRGGIAMMEAVNEGDGPEKDRSQISAALNRLKEEPSDRQALASLTRAVEGPGSEAAPTGAEIDQRAVALLIKAAELLAAAGQENQDVALALKLALTRAG